KRPVARIERAPRGRDRGLGVCDARGGELAEHLAAARIDTLCPRTIGGRPPLAVDPKPPSPARRHLRRRPAPASAHDSLLAPTEPQRRPMDETDPLLDVLALPWRIVTLIGFGLLAHLIVMGIRYAAQRFSHGATGRRS